MQTPLRIGSRESKLAVAQAEQLAAFCEKAGLPCEIITMKTTGDRILDRRLDQVGGKGLFVKELDAALRERRTDVSVHSAKDLPSELPEDLPILGFSRREDPRDALVLPKGGNVWDLERPVGCASARRMLQLRDLYPNVKFETVRGNVLTRLRKLDEGEFGALILAAAGLKRLGLEKRINRYFSTEEMIPAACQGTLCIQGRAGEDYSALAPFFDEDAAAEALAERAFIQTVNGGCTSPIAACAERDGNTLTLRALYRSETSGNYRRGILSGSAKRPETLGVALGMHLILEVERKERV